MLAPTEECTASLRAASNSFSPLGHRPARGARQWTTPGCTPTPMAPCRNSTQRPATACSPLRNPILPNAQLPCLARLVRYSRTITVPCHLPRTGIQKNTVIEYGVRCKSHRHLTTLGMKPQRGAVLLRGHSFAFAAQWQTCSPYFTFSLLDICSARDQTPTEPTTTTSAAGNAPRDAL